MGKEEEEYRAHETLLSEGSGFFASAAKEEWKEGQEHRITLPDDTPSVVDLYVQWIYSGRVLSRKAGAEEEGNDSIERGNGHEFDLLVGGFVFGEKVRDGDFKDAVIDALIHTVATPDDNGSCWYPMKKWVTQAYAGTPEGSPIRKLLVDMFMFNGQEDWLEGEDNVDFLVDLGRRLLADREAVQRKRQHTQDPTKPGVSSCQYHHHDQGDACYSEKIPDHVSGGDGTMAGVFRF